MKTVLIWELMRRKMFMLWWTVGISLLIGVTALSYLALGSNTKQLDQALGGLTSSAGSFFGGSDFFSPVGYLSSQIYFIMLPVLLVIMATVLASSLMNRDENDTTVELTLARPISRRELLGAKALAGLIIVAGICLLTYIVTLISVKIAGLEINELHLFITHVLSFAFSLSFGAISFALMAANRVSRKLATIVAIALVFGGYIVTSLAAFVDWLELPAKLMPYHYYDTVALLSGHVSAGLLWYLAGVGIVFSIVAAVGYSRRDIGS